MEGGVGGEGYGRWAHLPTDPFFVLRKGNWGAAGPGRFRGWETSGRGGGATEPVFGVPGAGEPRRWAAGGRRGYPWLLRALPVPQPLLPPPPGPARSRLETQWAMENWILLTNPAWRVGGGGWLRGGGLRACCSALDRSWSGDLISRSLEGPEAATEVRESDFNLTNSKGLDMFFYCMAIVPYMA